MHSIIPEQKTKDKPEHGLCNSDCPIQPHLRSGTHAINTNNTQHKNSCKNGVFCRVNRHHSMEWKKTKIENRSHLKPDRCVFFFQKSGNPGKNPRQRRHLKQGINGCRQIITAPEIPHNRKNSTENPCMQQRMMCCQPS